MKEGYDQGQEETDFLDRYTAVDPDPAQFVVENRGPDFFWRPMRSVNQFLARPTRSSPTERNKDFYWRPMRSDPQMQARPTRATDGGPDFFWRPMRSVNQFLARPTRTPTEEGNKDFFWRPMRSMDHFLVRPTRTPSGEAKNNDFFLMRPMKRSVLANALMRRSGSDTNPFWVRPTRSTPM